MNSLVETDRNPIREIDKIFRGLYIEGESKNAQQNYAREAKDPQWKTL